MYQLSICCGGCGVGLSSVGHGYPMVSGSLHFDQSWFSLILSIWYQKKLLDKGVFSRNDSKAAPRKSQQCGSPIPDLHNTS